MKKKRKTLYKEEDVAKYWDKHDLTEVIDVKNADRVELVYQPPVRSISLRLPLQLIVAIKKIAARMDIAYQALIKIWLAEKIKSQHL